MLSNTAIRSLGVAGQLRSPLQHGGSQGVRFRHDSERVLYDDTLAGMQAATRIAGRTPVNFEGRRTARTHLFRPRQDHRRASSLVADFAPDSTT